MAELITMARPYATAAFAYAEGQKKLSEWASMLMLLARAMDVPLMQQVIRDPRLLPEQIFTLLTELTNKSLDSGMQNFLRMLVKRQRLPLLPSIVELFNQLLAEYNKTITVDVLSAFPLHENMQVRMQHALQQRLQRTVKLHCQLDESLLGGAVVRAGDFVIDGSLRSKLQRLRAAMMMA